MKDGDLGERGDRGEHGDLGEQHLSSVRWSPQSIAGTVDDGLSRKGPENLLEGPDSGCDSLRRQSCGVLERASLLDLAPSFEAWEGFSPDDPFTISLNERVTHTAITIHI